MMSADIMGLVMAKIMMESLSKHPNIDLIRPNDIALVVLHLIQIHLWKL